MFEVAENTLQILSHTVNHYIRNNFSPAKIQGEEKVDYIWENGLHLNLGKNVDHTEYCLWLAANAPYYGVLVKDYATLTGLKQYYRVGIGKHTEVPKTVQLKLFALPKEIQVLVLANSTQWSGNKLKKTIRNWTTEKPILFIG